MNGNANSVCRNCAGRGHIVRSCPMPVSSSGCIAFRPRADAQGEFEYLMILRRNSLTYMEFVAGKYDPDDEGYLGMLLSNMTRQEREIVARGDFEATWKHAWQTANVSGKVIDEFRRSQERFEKVLPRLPDLLDLNPSGFEMPEWGFAKGRRRLNESTVDCGIREFAEETGIGSNDVVVYDASLVVEDFLGSNGTPYRHSYILVTVPRCGVEKDISMENAAVSQLREVQAVRWFTLEEAVAAIRPRNWSRIAMLSRIDARLREDYQRGSR